MTSDVGVITEDDIRRIVRDEVQTAFAKDPATRKAAIVASKGTLDWAYPPLILASSAAAIGMDASVFFTFYGLNIIHKDAARKLKVNPVGNPAMPMPVRIPDIVSSLPGMVPMASAMMRAKFAKNHVATIGELIATAQEMGVRFIACQMTVDVFGYAADDFIDGVEFAGATAYMAEARRAHVTMFI
ncbi:MAG: DsrE/DsrF/DrsH-like family protein [Micromonosporaceae bacterium]